MGDVVRLREDEGATAAAMILCAVRKARGVDAAMQVAKEMIIGASSILARETGPRHARHVLALAGQVLPKKRP